MEPTSPRASGSPSVSRVHQISHIRKPAVFIQDACYQHRFIRSRDISAIVERPERLRAVKLGIAGAIARLEGTPPHGTVSGSESSASKESHTESLASKASTTDELTKALSRLDIATAAPSYTNHSSPFFILHSSASIDLLNHAAVKFVHGDIDGDVYLEKLKSWAKESVDKIASRGTEIPEGLNQGDLYLCPESVDAIQGAVGTLCEAVDTVIMASRTTPSETANTGSVPAVRAFVAIRPPGHHCGEDTPSGFCFVNNVAIGAAHAVRYYELAHTKHGINRVAIFDIDLHHGNGTQSIAWQINEETYRQTLETEAVSVGGPPHKRGLQIYYGSIHDVLSFPCEDGKLDLVQAASVKIHGPHGQYVENVHLQAYSSENHFWETLYDQQYGKILRKAEEFFDCTGGAGDDTLILISCGFDACEHEYPSMSRHNRKVPVSFYHRFTRVACSLAERYARGRIVSVLEGGYSDRALSSGTMAHLCGFVEREVDESWWDIENLVKLEKATKKQKGGRPSLSLNSEPWLARAHTMLASLDADAAKYIIRSTSRVVPPSSRTLRSRNGRVANTNVEPFPANLSRKLAQHKDKPTFEAVMAQVPEVGSGDRDRSIDETGSSSSDRDSLDSETSEETIDGDTTTNSEVKKPLPRVILRLGPPPPALSGT